MNKIKIITDSASDLVAADMPDVTVLPITVSFGEEEYFDGVTITHSDFYRRLVESDNLPTTSLISPARFEEAFKNIVSDGQKAVVITMSSKLSGTYQSAVLAAAEFENEIFVVDSMSVAVGEQVLVRYAYELAQSGLDAEEIVSTLENARENLKVIALLDTLEYLKKGGRISKSVALVGGMLSIKPIVTVKDGEVAMLGTARGSRNGNSFLIKEIEKTGGIDFSKPVCLGYTGLDDEMLKKFMEDSEHIWQDGCERLNVGTIGATIGTHVGPNAVAVGFLPK